MPFDGFEMSVVQWVFASALCLCWLVTVAQLLPAWYLVRRRRRPEPQRWPSVSILKPLAGHDDELEANLESHVRLDYPGEYEVVLGVASTSDAAWPIARAFVERHPTRARLVVQEGEPGLNPKVNQLITLTRHARHEVLALTDANVRVPPGWLREHASYLAPAEVGLTSNAFYGTGEEALGAALDNLTLASFALPNIAAADVLLGITQVVAKSIAIKREALEAVGGWGAFANLLAEDQRLGRSLRAQGYRTAVCGLVVENVQRSQPLSHFWARSSRWAMIRFRVLVPGVYLEPLLNPTVMGTALLLVAPTQPWAWGAWAASLVWSMVFTQAMAMLGRRPFALKWVLLVPARDVLQFAAWVRGRFMRTVDWRGHRLRVGRETALTRP